MAKNSDMQNRGTNGTNEYGMKDCHNGGKNATSQNNAKNTSSQNSAKNASGTDCRDSYAK